MLLPTHAHGAQQADEGGGCREHDFALGGPDNEVAVAFEGGAEEGFGGEEEDDVIEGVGELARVVALGQSADCVLELGSVDGEGFAARGGIGGVNGLEEIQVGHLGVNDNDSVAGQMDGEVGFGVAGLGLLVEIAMGAHAGGFDDAAEGFLAPSAAGLVGTEDHAQLEGFAGKGAAVLGEALDLLFDFAEGGGLGGFVLLEAFLVGFQLLLQGLDEGGDGLLSLGEVAFGGFLEFGEGLIGKLQELRGGLLEGVGAEGAEGFAQVQQGLVLGFLGGAEVLGVGFAGFCQQPLGGLAFGFGGGDGVCRRVELLAGFGKFPFFLLHLLA